MAFDFGIQTVFGNLNKALMHRPKEEFGLLTKPHHWGFNSRPNIAEVGKEFDAIVSILKSEGVDVQFIETRYSCTPSLYMTRDLGFITHEGFVLSNFNVPYRRGEELYLEAYSSVLNIPIAGKIRQGHFEGGDLVMITDESAILGLGRTDSEGFDELMGFVDIELIPVKHTNEFGSHLDNSISMVNKGTALVFEKNLPPRIFKVLKSKGINCINAEPEEGYLFAVNVQRVKDNLILINEQAKVTIGNLERQGVDVIPVKMNELSKGRTGPRSMIFPLLRK